MDWLDGPESKADRVPDEGEPAGAELPGLPLGPQALTLATAAIEKRAQFVLAWESLTEKQRVFLNTWRECRFNASRAMRVLAATIHHTSKTAVGLWAADPNFENVRDLLRAASVEEILSKNYLALRQDDIVETLLTPKPILNAGFATGHFEVQAGAASKANEVLLRLGGHLKDRDIDINIGIVGPSLNIQVVQPTGEVRDITPRGVPIALPEPTDWIDNA